MNTAMPAAPLGTVPSSNADPGAWSVRSQRASRRLALVAGLLRSGARRASFVEDEVLGLGRLVGPGAVCVDVGAEFGLYTWSLADLVGPSGAVHAVEPQPDLGHLLRIGRRLTGAGNVTVHQLALGDRPGWGHLSRPTRRALRVHGRAFLSDRTTGLGSNAEFHHHQSIAVRVETLDALVDRAGLTRLDFIKADVEGAEGRLLAGGGDTIRRLRPALLLELEDRHLERFNTSAAAIVEALTALGYAPSHWENGDWRPGIRGRNVLFRMPAA
jgi:FkbM family methyltransferase